MCTCNSAQAAGQIRLSIIHKINSRGSRRWPPTQPPLCVQRAGQSSKETQSLVSSASEFETFVRYRFMFSMPTDQDFAPFPAFHNGTAQASQGRFQTQLCAGAARSRRSGPPRVKAPIPERCRRVRAAGRRRVSVHNQSASSDGSRPRWCRGSNFTTRYKHKHTGRATARTNTPADKRSTGRQTSGAPEKRPTLHELVRCQTRLAGETCRRKTMLKDSQGR